VHFHFRETSSLDLLASHIKGRVIDVSVSAARALGMMDAGVVMVSLGVD
jgi:hypothetical protein